MILYIYITLMELKLIMNKLPICIVLQVVSKNTMVKTFGAFNRV